MAKQGNGVHYSEALALKICALRADGMSLRQICKRPDMPMRQAVQVWLRDKPEFKALWLIACEDDAENCFEDLIPLADSATSENCNAVKVMIDTRKWVLSKRQPHKYGDKVAQDIKDAVLEIILRKKDA